MSVETEHAENCRSRYFDIDSICKQHLEVQHNFAVLESGLVHTSMIPQLQVSDFIDE